MEHALVLPLPDYRMAMTTRRDESGSSNRKGVYSLMITHTGTIIAGYYNMAPDTGGTER